MLLWGELGSILALIQSRSQSLCGLIKGQSGRIPRDLCNRRIQYLYTSSLTLNWLYRPIDTLLIDEDEVRASDFI